MLQQPYDLYKAGWADAYLMGLINQVRDWFIDDNFDKFLQVAQAFDDSVSQEVSNHLFQG